MGNLLLAAASKNKRKYSFTEKNDVQDQREDYTVVELT